MIEIASFRADRFSEGTIEQKFKDGTLEKIFEKLRWRIPPGVAHLIAGKQ